MSQMRIGLALSGGGFRAAAFHLGVLKRLEELQVLQRLSLLSTVSGGSITGALYALRCQEHRGRPGDYPVQALLEEMKGLLRSNLRGRAFLGTPVRAARAGLSWVLPPARRTPLLVEELDRQLFKGAKLSDVAPWITINATNLATGKNWRFFDDRAGDYLAGATDRTKSILLAEAVGASAAYPLLTDPYPFKTRWEHLRSDLLDERWERPPPRPGGGLSLWREHFGRSTGNVVMPLVDGGLYDNGGANALRGANITHAILSDASPRGQAHFGRGGLSSLLRGVDVMHARLGAASRQLAHEMTHGIHPGQARSALRDAAAQIRQSGDRDAKLEVLAVELEHLAAVGWPPRGHQFVATAPILLRRDDLARNVSSTYHEQPYDVPRPYRGVDRELVGLLSGVRTDLDALGDRVIDLLIAQGYFLTDAHMKIAMPGLVTESTGLSTISDAELHPRWKLAIQTVHLANENRADTATMLKEECRRSWIGRGRMLAIPKIGAG